MFCEYNKIKQVLSCKKCNQLLDEPKILPCGETICSKCQSMLQIDETNHFDCIICSNKHTMPKIGLPINKMIISLLLIEPKEVSRGSASKLLFDSLNKIKTSINELTFGIQNGTKVIQDYCANLRKDIQSTTQLANEQIAEFNKNFIAEINIYEKECLQRYQDQSKEKEDINKSINKMISFQSKWTDYLHEMQISDQVLNETNEKAIEMIKTVKNENYKLDNILFNNRIEFVKNKSDGILGHMTHIKIDSKIMSDTLFDLLMSICPFKINQKWKLLHRATENGFGSTDFHQRCDGKLNTLTVIKSKNNNIFGGYTEQDWTGNSEFKNDPNAFIFSLVNSFNEPSLFKCLDKHAIFCFQEYGPTFGYTGSISIRNQSNMVNSSSKPSISYDVPSNTYLAGAEYFLTTEIEVFLKE